MSDERRFKPWYFGAVFVAMGVVLLTCQAAGIWLATKPRGTAALFDWSYNLGLLAAVAALLTALVAALSLVVLIVNGSTNRAYAGFLLVGALAHIALVVAIGPELQEWRLQRLGRALEPSAALIAAIHSYERVEGRPPGSLDALVPQYLSRVSETGMGGYPQYGYRLDGVRWRLSIDVGRGLEIATLEHHPEGTYPVRYTTMLGEWAYVYID